MRSSTLALFALLSATVVLGQTPRGLDHVSLYSSALASGTGSGGSWKHSVGVALDYAWSRHWTTQLSAEAQSHEATLVRFVNGPGEPLLPTPSTYFRTFTTYPVDLQMTYRFLGAGRVTPFIGGGMRYVHSPLETPRTAQLPNGFLPVLESRPMSRGSAEISAGAMIGVTEHFGVTVEARRLVRNDGTAFDPLTKVSGGIAYRF